MCVCVCVQFIQSNYKPLIRALEPSLTVKAKDELATVLVSVLQSVDAVQRFLVDIVMDEVHGEGEVQLFERHRSFSQLVSKTISKVRNNTVILHRDLVK